MGRYQPPPLRLRPFVSGDPCEECGRRTTRQFYKRSGQRVCVDRRGCRLAAEKKKETNQ